MGLYDSNRLGSRGRRNALRQLAIQQRWIADCEANGRSYTGPNGEAIRAADLAELRRLEERLAEGQNHANW